MNITDLFGLFGGLALFLYGMQMMSNGLEDAAGNKMKTILEKITANRFMGVIVGAVITAIIQSSSATTVMVVGFVNSGLMTISQAVWLIMGANIGTTITGQLIALDVGMMAPIFAFIGVAMIVFLKSPKAHHFGMILAGLGILFIGMDMMGAAMEPLENSPAFINLMTTFSNPVVGIIAGAAFTALIQSSSASVGILQTLANGGLIPFSSAVFVLFGQNIGTCITAVLASIGTTRNAKRTTLVHLMFNVIGTCIFTLICISFPLADYVEALTPGHPATQIANMHTLFNIVTTALLLPFGNYMAKLTTMILPDKPEDLKEHSSMEMLSEEFRRNFTNLGSSVAHLDTLLHEVRQMISLAGQNTHQGFQTILNMDPVNLKEIESREKQIDFLNKELSLYISKILAHNNNDENITTIKESFLIIGNAERIGDHALNIAGYIDMIQEKAIVFSDNAKAELKQMQTIIQKAISKVLASTSDNVEWLSQIAAIEQEIDTMTETYREEHLNRMHQGLCSEEACIIYSELLTDFERIGDHILNIAQSYAKITF